MRQAGQLPLPFDHQPSYRATDFLEAPCNAAALAWLSRSSEWPQRRLALWGAPGTGKTHLLRIWADREGATQLQGSQLGATIAPPASSIALDDAAAASEQPLLHLINAAAEAGQCVLLAAEAPPARWLVALPDLASRLRATAAVELRPPDDELLRALLARLLVDRQLPVPEAIQSWLLLRLPRAPSALREAAARLDEAALRTGGRVTRALAAQILRDMRCLDDDPAQ